MQIDSERASDGAALAVRRPLLMDVAAASSYLRVLARTLNDVIAPALQGRACSVVQDCITIAVRVAQQLDAGQAESARLYGEAAAAAQRLGTLQPKHWRVLAQAEGAALDAFEEEAVKLATAYRGNAANARAVDRARIERYLQEHPLGGTRLRVTEAAALSGGRSKQTILVAQEGARDLPARFVIRQDWLAAKQDWAKDATRGIAAEFEVLKHAARLGLRTPRPILVERSSEPLGAPFLAVGCMPGRQEGDLFCPPPREALALQLAQQLAALHRAPVAEVATAANLCTRSHTREEMNAELAASRTIIAKLDVPSQTVGIALDWLQANLPQLGEATALIHGDVGFHNIMVEGETLTALLDWELAHLGHPAQDLGYCRNSVEKMTSWPRFMAAYREAGGPDVPDALTRFYALWSSVWLYATLLQAREGVKAGMLNDAEVVVFCAHFLPMLRQRMSLELRAVLNA
ncbi:MAG: phosphotransferase [Sinobacteraceae bacterium]|nr:phosphotransferase [Nevskiaceae bacterium]